MKRVPATLPATTTEIKNTNRASSNQQDSVVAKKNDPPVISSN